MTAQHPKEKLLALLREAVAKGSFVKLTLGGHRGADATLQNVFVRPVALRAGRQLQFVYRHATRDITKNLAPDEAYTRITELLDHDFRTAHLFTAELSAELEIRNDRARLRLAQAAHVATDTRHDRPKQRLIDPHAAWLRELGIINTDGSIRKEMGYKFRQINKFVEILCHLFANSPSLPCPESFRGERNTGETGDTDSQGRPATNRNLRLVDMGCGKGYVTFAAYDWLCHNGWPDAEAIGIEARQELVDLCNRVAQDLRFGGLHFEAGTIDALHVETLFIPPLSPRAARGEGVRRTGEGHTVDVLVALHACDTATDNAIAKGVKAGAALIIVAPCCHKELRPQLRAPPVLAPALKHGIFRERQAEFVTDALRAALLEWAGYETKVFEFISTEHTAKNLMIAAVKRQRPANREELAIRTRQLAAFYGLKNQRLAEQMGFLLPSP